MTDVIEWQHVTGAWKATDYDSRDDQDALPEQIPLKGKVTFRARFDARDRFEAISVPALDGSYMLSLREMVYPTVRGRLIDRQGRDGVWLPAVIGGVPVVWTAIPELETDPGVGLRGEPLPSDRVTFGPAEPDSEGRRVLSLADVAATDREYAEPIVARVALLTSQSLAARDDSLEGAVLAVLASELADEAESGAVAAEAGAVAARDDSLEGAALSVLASVLADESEVEARRLASAAEESASTASQKAGEATSAREVAVQKAEEITGAAATATQKAGEASQSADDAARSAAEAASWVGAPADGTIRFASMATSDPAHENSPYDALFFAAMMLTGFTSQGGWARDVFAEDVQQALERADTAYQRPAEGVPLADLAVEVQTSLGRADSAVQPEDVDGLTWQLTDRGAHSASAAYQRGDVVSRDHGRWAAKADLPAKAWAAGDWVFLGLDAVVASSDPGGNRLWVKI